MKKRNVVELPRGPVPVEQFIAIGPYCWGKGVTQKEAVKNCLRYGSKLRAEQLSIYAFSKKDVVAINDMGHIDWPLGVVCMKVQEGQS